MDGRRGEVKGEGVRGWKERGWKERGRKGGRES